MKSMHPQKDGQHKWNHFWTLMSETDLLPNIQGPLLSQSTRVVNCAGMHFYYVYNHPVQALRQIHHSVVLERNWLASRHYREPSIWCCFIDWQSLCPVSVWLEYSSWNQRICGSNGCEGKDKIQKKLKTVVKTHWTMATLKNNCRKSM